MQTDGTATRPGPVAVLLRLATRRAVGEAAAVAVLSLIPAALYLPFLGEPLFADEAVYSVIGRGLLDGQLPYRDLFDNKPPVLYGWFALSFLLFGEEPWAPRLLAAAVLAGTAALVHMQARLLFSRRAAYGVSVAFGATGALATLTADATSEIFMLLPMTASLVATTIAIRRRRGRWLLLAGVLGGLALMTKPVALWNGLALAAFILIWGWRTYEGLWPRLRPAVLLAAGAAAGSALAVLPMMLTGTFDELFDAIVTFPMQYRAELSDVDRLKRFAVGALARFPLFGGALVLATVWGFALLLRRRRWPDDHLLLLWALGSAIGVASPGFFFRHYFVQLFPAMALLTVVALGSRHAIPRPAFRPAANIALVAVWGVTIATAVALNGPAYTASTPEEQHVARGLLGSRVLRENASEDVAAFLTARMQPEDAIYVHGPETAIYIYADRQPVVRYFYWTPIRVRRDRGVFTEIVASLRAQRPAWIVDTFVPTSNEALSLSYIADGSIDLHPPEFQALLDEQYEFVAHVVFADIYRLRQ